MCHTPNNNLTPPISLPGSSERSVKVSGSREEVTQCIYHICDAVLDCPVRGDTRLYRPDKGFSDDRGYSSRGSSSRMSDRSVTWDHNISVITYCYSGETGVLPETSAAMPLELWQTLVGDKMMAMVTEIRGECDNGDTDHVLLILSSDWSMNVNTVFWLVNEC